MTSVINIHDAKTHFSKYVDKVALGGEVIIGKHGKPVAKLVPFSAMQSANRKPGILKNKLWMADDFDETPAEVAASLNKDV
jgi:prevent-host-death family protein